MTVTLEHGVLHLGIGYEEAAGRFRRALPHGILTLGQLFAGLMRGDFTAYDVIEDNCHAAGIVVLEFERAGADANVVLMQLDPGRRAGRLMRVTDLLADMVREMGFSRLLAQSRRPGMRRLLAANGWLYNGQSVDYKLGHEIGRWCHFVRLTAKHPDGRLAVGPFKEKRQERDEYMAIFDRKIKEHETRQIAEDREVAEKVAALNMEQSCSMEGLESLGINLAGARREEPS